jgi:hypothetical protein
MHFCAFIRNTFFVIVFIFKGKSPDLPKLEAEGLNFRYVKERKFNRSYVYVMGLKSELESKK